MIRCMLKLWKDQRGSISALSTLLLYTVLILGMVAGLVTLRNQIVQEYGDLSVALDHLDQSWSITFNGETRGFTDTPGLSDPIDAEPAGLSIQEPPIAEGDPLSP